MTTYAWEVQVKGATISDVQSITVQMGRRQITDRFRANTATITGRVLASLGTPDIGDVVRIYADDGIVASPQKIFQGRISDVQVNYGMVTNEDTWVIQVEDDLALLGRAVTSSSFSWSAGLGTFDVAQDVALDTNHNAYQIGATSSSTVSVRVPSSSHC